MAPLALRLRRGATGMSGSCTAEGQDVPCPGASDRSRAGSKRGGREVSRARWRLIPRSDSQTAAPAADRGS